MHHHPYSSQDSSVICLSYHIYAPTNPVSTSAEASVQSDKFYNLLQDTLSSVPSRDMVIILGDFDASIGYDFVLHSSVISPHGLGECNENGMRPLDFVQATSSSLLTHGSSTSHSIRRLGTAIVIALDLITLWTLSL